MGEENDLVDMDVPRIYAGEARLLGATFNVETRKWQAPSNDLQTFAHVDRNQMTTEQLADVQAEIDAVKGQRQYLDVAYENKEAAKELGARYDGEEKAWYVEKGANIKPFAEIDMNQWTPEKKQEYQASKQPKAQVVSDAKKKGEWIPMDIHYDDRKEAAKLGGHYNKEARRWEAHSAETLGKFAHIDRNQMTPEQRKEHGERIQRNLDLKNDITKIIDRAIDKTKTYQNDMDIKPDEEHATDEAIEFLNEAKMEFRNGQYGEAAFSMHCASQIEKYNPMENLNFSTEAAREIDAVMANEMGKGQWQAIKDQNIEEDLEEPAIAESQKRNLEQVQSQRRK
jgi:hypothetical protein